MVEERIGCKTTNFSNTRSGFVKPAWAQFEKLQQANKSIKVVWQDNAGESKKLHISSDQAAWKLKAQFGHTAKDTPQQNYSAEFDFTTIAAKAGQW